MSELIAYLITFRTCATWLQGDDRGSIDREHNTYSSPLCPSNPALKTAMRGQLKGHDVTLDGRKRKIVEQTIDEVCRHRGWTLHVRHARSNHVHLAVSADTTPERLMGTIMSWRTRRLREQGSLDRESPIWSRHGSTKYL